jgi:sec-independent protein translocase protein TatB
VLGIGLPEFFVIGVVAMLVFGPDRLPEFAKQAGRMIRQLRTLSRQARDDIRSELGPDYADFELRDLDPRRAIRKHIIEAWDEDDPDGADDRPSTGPALAQGERPPYDPEAT